jgi:hypothetical protein
MKNFVMKDGGSLNERLKQFKVNRDSRLKHTIQKFVIKFRKLTRHFTYKTYREKKWNKCTKYFYRKPVIGSSLC